MRSLPQLIAKYLETGTGDIQTLSSGVSSTTNLVVASITTGAATVGNLAVQGILTMQSSIDTSATPGNATVNSYPTGIAAFAAAGTVVTLTNNGAGWPQFSTCAPRVFASLATADATAVLGACFWVNSTTVSLNLKTACTGTTKVSWWVVL